MFSRTLLSGARMGVGALALSVVLGSCGGDSTGSSDTSLDQALSMELLGYLFGITWVFLPDAQLSTMPAPAASTGAAWAPMSNLAVVSLMLARDTYTFDETSSCPRGGNIRMQGTIVDDTNAQGTGPVSLQFTQTPNGCRVDTDERGIFEMNGNPNLGFSFSANFIDDEPAEEFLTAKYTGGFRWNGDGRTGSCSMDLTFRISWLSDAVTVTGTLCGNSVNFSG
jgi:hypothetical protein